jgi:hypothetical protein
VAAPIFVQQLIHPGHAEAAGREALVRPEKMHVGLGQQEFQCAVDRAVIGHEET